jgi:hypothetical protein
MYCTGEKINITQIEGQFPQAPFPKREHREAFVKDWFQVPDDKFKQYFLDWEPRGENSIPYYPTPQMTCDIVDWQERMHYIDDALGMCAGLSSFPSSRPTTSTTTRSSSRPGAGIEMDEDKLTRRPSATAPWCGPSTSAGACAAKDDAPPEDHWKKRFPELEKSCWTPTTRSRAGTPTAFPPKSPCTSWAWITWPRTSIASGDLERTEASPAEVNGGVVIGREKNKKSSRPSRSTPTSATAAGPAR